MNHPFSSGSVLDLPKAHRVAYRAAESPPVEDFQSVKELLTAQLVLAEAKLQTLKEDGTAKQARIAELASINEKQVASLVLYSH